MGRALAALAAAGILTAAVPPPAHAASVMVIRGRGFGHGVGMSQYGAYGYALRGTGYADILAHYYTGTALSALPGTPEVRVLLAAGRTTATVRRADRAGTVPLDPARDYTAAGDGTGGVVLKDDAGRKVARSPGPMRLTATAGPVTLLGTAGDGLTDAAYRGAIEVRPSAAGALDVIDAVGLEDYVRGVVAAESPASWPADALRAQAVAARTYAITGDAGGPGDGYTQYADTRSQVYHGVAAETAPTDAAVAVTRGQVVTYAGTPVTTYFFSASGGRTENVENAFPGSAAEPYLVSVRDPYDTLSPRHTWTVRLTPAQAGRRLSGLVKGALRRITVTRRGVSPRILRATIIGTAGRTPVDGVTLRRRLGLYDTWATFGIMSTRVARAAHPRSVPEGGEPRAGGATTARLDSARLRGRLTPSSPRSRLRVQAGEGAGRWRTIVVVHPDAAGRYTATVPGPGVYRVAAGGLDGPSVRIR